MSKPNVDQILSLIRWLLSVGGPLTAILISRGMTADQVSTLQASLIAIVGALPPIVSIVWGLLNHTDSAKLKAVEAMPDVKSIVVTNGGLETIAPKAAVSAAAFAAADPSRPKVVTVTDYK